MSKLNIILSCFFLMGSVHAGSMEGKVGQLLFVQKNGVDQGILLATLEENTDHLTIAIPSSTSGCNNVIPGRWAIDGNTNAGKMQISALLSAQAQRKTVKIYGYDIAGLENNCHLWPDTESVYWLAIE